MDIPGMQQNLLQHVQKAGDWLHEEQNGKAIDVLDRFIRQVAELRETSGGRQGFTILEPYASEMIAFAQAAIEGLRDGSGCVINGGFDNPDPIVVGDLPPISMWPANNQTSPEGEQTGIESAAAFAIELPPPPRTLCVGEETDVTVSFAVVNGPVLLASAIPAPPALVAVFSSLDGRLGFVTGPVVPLAPDGTATVRVRGLAPVLRPG